ncbi:metal ABC transporter permease [Bernardetia sp.]|uniref:metal ABC transporter permease n=1 Tax=Bernardetia sp. TaxID=1937974 RepID=UPI0025B9A4A7|nr:metal ABC transporter permease [Bernardetia sp.]
MNDFQIILVGVLVAISCAILGCFLILRKMAMVGDAISHAVLPGIVIAFLVVQRFDSIFMLLGAAVLGVFTTLLIEFLHRQGKLQTDASIGVSFTFLFAVGVILISVFASKVDIDADCVLFGEIAYVPLDVWRIDLGDGAILNLGATAAWWIGSVLLIILVFVSLFYKEMLLTTFDSSFASAIGINTSVWHYSLMSLVSLATVAAFESVGAVLVLAFLVVPPATSYLLTTNFKKMLLISCCIGTITAILGYYVASYLNASIAGTMTSVAGVIFFIVFVLVRLRK